MKLQRQPNRFTCLITSCAMLLDVDVAQLIDEVGHDGSGEQLGHHPQELLSLVESRQKALTAYELIPNSRIGEKVTPVWNLPTCHKRFLYLLKVHECIMTGLDPNGQLHAWAWDRNRVFDPLLESTDTGPLDEYQPQYLFVARAVQCPELGLYTQEKYGIIG